MKKLDLLSRVELGTIAFLAGAIVFGTTGVVAFFVIEYFLPEDWPTLLRHGLAIGGAGVFWLLSIVGAAIVEDAFSGLRRLLRRPTLNDAIAEVQRANRGHSFVPVPDLNEIERQRHADYRWVMKYQLVAAVVVVTGLLQYGYTTGGWIGWAAGVVGMLVAYWTISVIVGLVDEYKDEQHKEIDRLRRQLAAFVCDVQKGTIEKADIERLSAAIRSQFRTCSDQRLGDDWTLISRTWNFWREGVKDQDDTTCANCGAPRRSHGVGGKCSRGDTSDHTVQAGEDTVSDDTEQDDLDLDLDLVDDPSTGSEHTDPAPLPMPTASPYPYPQDLAFNSQVLQSGEQPHAAYVDFYGNEVRRWIQRDDSLDRLFRSLGYSAHLESRCRALWGRLVDLSIRITDVQRFQDALDAALQEAQERGRFTSDEADLLDEIIKVRDNIPTVVQLLQADPMMTLPDAVEQSIERVPKDLGTFTQTLDELQRLFREPSLIPEWRHKVRGYLLEALRGVRKHSTAAACNVAGPLQSLSGEIERYVKFISDDKIAEAKREALKDVLLVVVQARHGTRRGDPLDEHELAIQARRYIDAPWMHRRAITLALLRAFLDAAAAAQPREPLLTQTAQHVASAHFDGPEVARRLRELEARGLYIHTLIYPLLRLYDKGDAAVSDHRDAAPEKAGQDVL
jgi:hypothetical protein